MQTRIRLQTVLFLQGSPLYNPQAIRDRLVEHQKILRLELAILDGKVCLLLLPQAQARTDDFCYSQLGEHRAALTSLVHDLKDTTAAEIYCTLGGEVVPAKTAQSLGERFSLQAWASLLVPTISGKQRPGAIPMSRPVTVDSDLKKSLIRILLEVYLSEG